MRNQVKQEHLQAAAVKVEIALDNNCQKWTIV